MTTFKGLGAPCQNKKQYHVTQEVSGSSSRSTPSPSASLLKQSLTPSLGLGSGYQNNKPEHVTHLTPSPGLGSGYQNNKPGHVTQAISGSSSRSTPSPPISLLGRRQPINTTKQMPQTKQPPQPPSSQYSVRQGPRPNLTPLNHQKQSPTLSHQQHPSTSHIHDDLFEDNEDVEEEIIDWKPNTYGDLKWGEEPLDPFKSISVAKFQRPNIGVNATGELVNISVNKTSLKFQGILSKQIKYNLHPAGQQWKWVPKRTKQLM
ncbi:unnamed protein product [Cuscuta epithymum]|uniref:Uncharacterized protein n=1 Tax=Cuscuta epithymum TaxID=186058 RepID=A0AAV0EAP1_9ASTE|nr:unnamed protein product [Cuscuta epithymum]